MRFLSAIFVSLLLVPSVSQAAMLYLDPPREVLQQGDSVIIAVRLDVDQATGECINAADVTVTYPDDIQAVDVTTRRSIFPLWVEKPRIDPERNRVTFVGGILNGYCGRIDGDPGMTNILAEIIFRSAQPIEGLGDELAMAVIAVEIDDKSVLTVNDGSGTAFHPETFGSAISVFPSSGIQIRDPWREIVQADTLPPEPFSIELERDPNVFRGDYFITFNTTDKQSGIALYEVMEEPLSEQQYFRFGEVGAPWVEARSPYRLKDQTLNSTIRVRAIDKAGNTYVATFVPDPSLRTRVVQPHEWFMLTAAGVFLVFGFGYFLYRRRIKQDDSYQSNNESL